MHIQSYTGTAAHPFLPDLARLRVSVFRDFPYLYDGSMENEQDYLRTFLDTPDSVIVVAFDGDKVVGVSTGKPMEHETESIRKPWRDHGFDPGRIFYYGESVLDKNYRGSGIGVRFFEERERWARSLNRFDYAAFCAVVRPEDHPLRPAGYHPLDDFWKKRGFAKSRDLVCYIRWQDVGETAETEKALRFWWKRI